MTKLKTKIIIFSISAVIALAIIIGVASIFFYNQVCGVRYQTADWSIFQLSDFPNLKRNRYEFLSNKGQKLVGYNYFTENENIKGIIILSHGFGGGGHNHYMPCANYFANNGYYAFCFDITGNDESEGKSVKGLEQGVIDLNYAISFVKEQEEFKNLPIMLFGHSWGGFSIATVLNYQNDIKGIVSMAGFNKTHDLIKSWGEDFVGKVINFLVLYIDLYKQIQFGDYASKTAMSGFENTNTKAMIVHSEDDNVVEKKYGYDIYYEKYKDNPRFNFVQYNTRGHNYIFYSDKAREELAQLGNKKTRPKYFKNNLSKDAFENLLDENLFKEIILFYDSCLD